MKTKNQVLDQQLRSLDPVDEPGLALGLTDADTDETLRAILSSDQLETARPRSGPVDLRSRRGLPRSFLAPAAAGATLTAVLALTLLGAIGGNGRVVPALDEAAAAAAARPAPQPDSSYRYLKTRSTSVDTSVAGGESWSVRRTEIRELWVADDRSGRLRVTLQPAEFVGPGDRAAAEAAGGARYLPDPGSRTADRSIPAGGTEVDQLGLDPTNLPTDPDRLSDELARRVAQRDNSVPPAAATLDLIGEILRDPVSPPDVRAALYEAATEIPDIEYLGAATDSIGREGVAVGVTSDYSGGKTLFSLIFDPETSRVLEARATQLEAADFADTASPFVLNATTYVAAGLVNMK